MKKVIILLIILILSGCSITIPDGQNNNDNNDNIDTNDGSNDNVEQTPIVNPPNEEISYFGSDNDVYRINITTENNEFPKNTNDYINGSLNITEQDKSITLKSDMSMKIRLRGNSTSAPEKKPFKIKFDEEQSLFGLTAAKDWALLANYFDKTNLRNHLAYTLANKLDGLGFQPSSIFVDVYFNGQYQGLYTLCEHIEANEGRVDIKNNVSSDGISSFLIEVDDRAVNEYEMLGGMCYVEFKEYIFTFKNPDRDKYVQAKVDNNIEVINEYEKNIYWFNDFIEKAYNSLEKGNYTQFSKYFDINSFMDYYIVQEFFKNVDVSSTSQYYIIDQSNETPKLACGPVWDFDIAAGVVDGTTGIYTYYENTKLYVKEVDMFYRMLFSNPTFKRNFKARYAEVRDILQGIIYEIDNLKNDLSKAQNRNLKKWPLGVKGVSWIELNAISPTYHSFTTLNQHYRHLKNTLTNQLSILDQAYL